MNLPIEKHGDTALATTFPEQRESRFLTQLPVGILLLDAAGTVFFQNAAASNLLHYAGNLPCHVSEIDAFVFDESGRQTSFHEWLTRCITVDKGCAADLLYVLPAEGNSHWVRCTVQKLAEAETETVMVTLYDVTEKHTLIEALQHNASTLDYNLQLVLDNTDDTLIILNTHFEVITFNKAAVTSFALLHKSLLQPGAFFFDLVKPEDKEELTLLFQQVLNGEKQELQRLHDLADGTLVVYQNSLRPLFKNQEVIGVIIAAKDITEKYLIEAKLKASNERFGRASMASYDIIWEHDLVNHRLFLSDNFGSHLGYPATPMMSANYFTEHIVHPGDQQQLLQAVAAFLPTAETHFTYPVHRLMKGDGTFIYVEANAVASRDEKGKAYRLTGVTRDITARYLLEQQLRESNERFERASQASYDIIWEANLKTRSIYFSDSFYRLMGYGPGEVLTVEDLQNALIHPVDLEKVQAETTALFAGRDHFLQFPEHRLRKKDGTYIYVEAKAMASRKAAGEVYLLTGVIHDITLHRLNEMELQELNKQLKLRAAELEASNNELERFAYVASHDLQEPLRMVSSFLSLLKKRFNHVLDDTGRQYIGFAVDGAERMKQLIQDLLEFSRIGTNKGVYEPVELNALVRRLLQQFTFSTEEKKAVVEVTHLPTVMADKSQLTQVFQNLFSNALKYNKSGAPLIRIGCTEAERHYEFFVRDNGIGIHERYAEKIFVIFQQLHPRNEYGGTGIGLAITKKIIEGHGGKIWVQSAPGNGATFYFTIPKTKTARHEA